MRRPLKDDDGFSQQPSIVKSEDIKDLDKLDEKEGTWATGGTDDVDYSEKLIFSDEESDL